VACLEFLQSAVKSFNVCPVSPCSLMPGRVASIYLEYRDMLESFYNFSTKRVFWFAIAGYFFLMEMIALFYQYVLDYYPCALCVQVRAWIWGAVFTAVATSFFHANFWLRWAGLTLTGVFLGGGLYTSWYAWGVERGTVISSCTMGAGFPEFMPLDQWIPILFRADGFCGQSPPMWLGLSMVETLLITIGLPLLALIAAWLLNFRVMGQHAGD